MSLKQPPATPTQGHADPTGRADDPGSRSASTAGSPTGTAGSPTSTAGSPTSTAGSPTSTAGRPDAELVPEEQETRRQVILLAGPSGSGKSHIAQVAGVPIVHLDDFYKSGDDPSCPRHPSLGIVDWDDPGSWNSEAALAALMQLCRTGRAEVPIYDITADGPSGTQLVNVSASPFVAEGIFAAEMYQPCKDAGILLDAIVVHRARWKNLLRRAARDLKEHRKPPTTILRRGVELYRNEDRVVARALRAGFRSLDAVQTRQALMAWRASPIS